MRDAASSAAACASAPPSARIWMRMTSGGASSAPYVLMMGLAARFREHVLVLPVAHDERPFPAALGDDELETAERGIDRDERNAAIVVHARSGRAFPFADVEHRGAAFLPDRHVAERAVVIAAGELRGLRRIGGDLQMRALLGDRGLHLPGRRSEVLDRFGAAGGQHFEQPPP